MIYDWYYIADLQEFIDTGLVSRQFDVQFPFGTKNILLTSGKLISMLYDGIFISVGLNEKNPSSFEGIATYYDSDGFLWLGILNEN
jgi:hypothetical protein